MTTEFNSLPTQSKFSLTGNDVRETVTIPPSGSLRERRRRRSLRDLLLVILATISINAAVTSLLITWRMPTVVSFDMKKTLDQFTEQARAQSLDKTHITALSARFMANLNDELKDWQQHHDALILVTPAVVSDTDDITNEIQNGVANRMAAGDGR